MPGRDRGSLEPTYQVCHRVGEPARLLGVIRQPDEELRWP